MLLRKLFLILFLSCILAFGTAAAFAAPFLPGEVQLLEDEDAEVLMDSTGAEKVITPATQIQVGDLFGGVIKIQRTQNVPSGNNDTSLQPPAPDTFTSIFLIETLTNSGDGISGNNSVDTLTFGAASAADWASVFGAGGLLDVSAHLDVTDLDGFGTGVATGTMAMMFEGVAYQDADPTTGTYSTSTGTYVDGANLLYEFGFTGAGGVAGLDEFWTTIGIDAEFPALIGTNNPTNRLSLNVTKWWDGPELLPFNHLGTVAPFDGNFTGPVQLQGKGDFAGTTTGPWGIITDTDLYIDSAPIPEPGTMLLLGFGLIGLAGVTRRKS